MVLHHYDEPVVYNSELEKGHWKKENHLLGFV